MRIRYVFSVIMARISYRLLRMMGRNATHFPGAVALKICPDVLARLAKPNKIIAITGTNGKTTVTNLIADSLKQQGKMVVSNHTGSNIQEGIITSLLHANSFFGLRAKDCILVLEVDERVSLKIYPYLKPDILVITNLFRDSYRRNAHIEYIANILEDCIPEETQLILNADDPISSKLCLNNPRINFSLLPLINEIEVRDSRIQDLTRCPVCYHRLEYRFQRYHHIGKVYCPNCGFKSSDADVVANMNADMLDIQTRDFTIQLSRIGDNIIDTYNLLACVSCLIALGQKQSEIEETVRALKIVESRFDRSVVDGKQVIIMMTKDQNPVATSRVFDYIRHQTHQKIAIILINENSEHRTTSENMAWYYDCDFEYLNQDFIKQIIGGGMRCLDLKYRLCMAGVQESVISITEDELNTSGLVDFSMIDTVYILNGTKNIPEAQTIKQRLLEQLKGGHHGY